MMKMTKSKYNVSVFVFIILGTTAILFAVTKKYYPDYPSDYAKIAPEVEFPVEFGTDSVTFHIPESERGKAHIIYAILDETHQYGILDPTLSSKITITPGTYASYVLNIEKDKIGKYSILKKPEGYSEKIDLYSLILEAKASGGKFGVQRCLSPFCNICVEECKKVKGEERLAVELVVDKRGKVVPVYYSGYCPRCGICFMKCPVSLLMQSGIFDEKVK